MAIDWRSCAYDSQFGGQAGGRGCTRRERVVGARASGRAARRGEACDCGICGFDDCGDLGLVARDFLARAEVQDDSIVDEGVHLGPVIAQLEVDLLQKD